MNVSFRVRLRHVVDLNIPARLLCDLPVGAIIPGIRLSNEAKMVDDKEVKGRCYRYRRCCRPKTKMITSRQALDPLKGIQRIVVRIRPPRMGPIVGAGGHFGQSTNR